MRGFGFGGYSLGFPAMSGRPSFSSMFRRPSVKSKSSQPRMSNRFKNGKRNRMGRVSDATLKHLNQQKLKQQQQAMMQRLRQTTPATYDPRIRQNNSSLGTYRGAMGNTMFGGYRLF